MIAMQYKISLSDDYDMNTIRERVSINGEKTDGFLDLLLKAYLISENKNNEKGNNEYSPLYLWKDRRGMNKFIFEGYYNNILNSFGWQNINIGIPFKYHLEKNFPLSQYVLEIENKILKTSKMELLDYSYNTYDCLGKLLIYNPDKWKYIEYYFFKNLPTNNIDGKIYSILHLSM